MLVAAIDLGFGRCKGALGERRAEFPAIAAPAPTLDLGEFATRRILTDPDGARWLVGDDATGEQGRIAFSAGKAEQPAERAKALRLLAELMRDVPELPIDRVIAGLPVHELAAQKDAVRRLLLGIHRFTFDGRRYTVTVGDVRVIPQGAGAFYAVALRDGRALPDAPAGRVAVLDLGYRTLNVVGLDGGRYLADRSGTLDLGVSRIHLEAQRRILARHGFAPDLGDMDAICRAKTLMLGGRSIDASEIVSGAAQAVAERIAEETQAFLGDPLRYTATILAGGGAQLVRPWLEQAFPAVMVPPQPQMANALGYLEYGLLLARQSA